MSELILVKNANETGHIMLKASSIVSVRDRCAPSADESKGKSVIQCQEECGPVWYDSASTASEVLAAIHEAQGVVPRSTRETFGIDIYAEPAEVPRLRFHRNADTSQANGEKITSNTILAGPIGVAWSHSARLAGQARLQHYTAQANGELTKTPCTCPQYQGDNPACPVHGEGTAWGLLHGDK